MKTLTSTVAMLLLAACGGGDGSSLGMNSGVPRATALASLTQTQAGTLCDWTTGKQGGYGRTVSCSDGSQQGTDPDKATCMESIPYIGAACPTLTVANIEDCASAVGRDVCQLQTHAACAEAKACFDSIGI